MTTTFQSFINIETLSDDRDDDVSGSKCKAMQGKHMLAFHTPCCSGDWLTTVSLTVKYPGFFDAFPNRSNGIFFDWEITESWPQQWSWRWWLCWWWFGAELSSNRPCWDHHNNDAENLTPCSETLARRPLLEMDDDGDDEGFVVVVTTIMI